jgi:hypothetical protein
MALIDKHFKEKGFSKHKLDALKSHGKQEVDVQ